MSKYHSSKITTGGQTFDSMEEYRRWRDLCLMARAGVISDLRRQVRFVLIPTQRGPDHIGPKGGRKAGPVIERSCVYVADFVYVRDGKTVVEDSKGMRTPEYIIKRKLMLWVHGIHILET